MKSGGKLHPMQQAFSDQHGLQCGYCTPGMMATAIAFLKQNPQPTEAEIRDALSGNLCRCTGYNNIVKAVMQAAAELSAPPLEPVAAS
jgi:carbon-monoxide dehydrogenase small subunit